jgi:hypothetical protein
VSDAPVLFCKDCRWHHRFLSAHWCKRPLMNTPNLVTGKPLWRRRPCYEERSQTCGQSAQYFQPKDQTRRALWAIVGKDVK